MVRLKAVLRWQLSLAVALCAGWLLHAPAAADKAPEKRVALIIGNGAYQSVPPLGNPVKDALSLASRLRRLGFVVEHVADQNKAGMEDALGNFARKLGEDADVALFFYAGHGLQLADQNYLVPVDAALATADDVRLRTIRLNDVIETIQSHARVGIVILDACRNNPLANRIRGSSRSIGRGLKEVDTGNGDMLVVYATSPGQEADDGAGGNSPFTTALLDHIGDPGVDVQTMFRTVTRSVLAQTQNRQKPWQLGSLTSEIYLAGAPDGVARVAPAPTPAVAPSDGTAAELAYWNSVSGSSRADDFADYLREYPNGKFVRLAKRRLEDLQRKTPVRGDAPVAVASTPSASGSTPGSTPTPAATQPSTPVSVATRTTAPASPGGGSEGRRGEIRFHVPGSRVDRFTDFARELGRYAGLSASVPFTTEGAEPTVLSMMREGTLDCAALSPPGVHQAETDSAKAFVIVVGVNRSSRTGGVVCSAKAWEAFSPDQQRTLKSSSIRLSRGFVPLGPNTHSQW